MFQTVAEEMLSGLSDEELSKLHLDRTEPYLLLTGEDLSSVSCLMVINPANQGACCAGRRSRLECSIRGGPCSERMRMPFLPQSAYACALL